MDTKNEKQKEKQVPLDTIVKRKVADWISWHEAQEKEEAIGGMGGFFNAGLIHPSQKDEVGMRWDDYINVWEDEAKPYAEAIREEVLEHGLKITGQGHQVSNVPLFDDGKVGCFSYRAWGDIMAAIWSEEEDKDYSYMDFYM